MLIELQVPFIWLSTGFTICMCKNGQKYTKVGVGVKIRGKCGDCGLEGKLRESGDICEVEGKI